IRVPGQGLNRVTPELAPVLKHELTHSFINEKTHGRCPTWLQEGAAQWMEGKRTDARASAELLGMYDRHEEPSLNVLEPFWMTVDPDFVRISYAWALAVIEAIESASPGDLERILDRLGEGGFDGLDDRSEEHTSELQSRGHLVCRLLLEKKKKHSIRPYPA